jgi:hypothetical protein
MARWLSTAQSVRQRRRNSRRLRFAIVFDGIEHSGNNQRLAMQTGVDKWEAAGFLGMTVEMLDRVYGHHHPDHLKTAARAIGYRPRQSLGITLVAERTKRRPRPQRIEKIGGAGRTRTCNQAVMSEARSPEDQAKSDDSDVT